MSASLTVAFDLTGTLTKHSSSFFAFMAGHAEMTSSRVLSAGHNLFEVARGVKRCFISTPVIPPSFKRAVLDHVSPLRPSASAVLTSLRVRGAHVALLSNDPKDALGARVIRYNGLANLFDSMVFPEDVQGLKKPDPSGLLRIINDRADHPGVVIMVGDKASDMLTADNAERVSGARIHRVAVGQESSAAEYIRYDGRGVVLNRLRELPEVVETISRSMD